MTFLSLISKFRVLKNDQPNAPIDFHTLPPVLKDAITKMPNILEENRSFKCIYSSKEVLQILNKEGNFHLLPSTVIFSGQIFS